MATGDAAAAAGMDTLTGNEPANTLDTEINKTRDYIADRTSTVTPVAKGGTGATNAAAARSNLGAVGSDEVYVSGSVAGKIPRYDGSGRLIVASPAAANQAASKAYVDAASSGLVSLTYLNQRIGPGASQPIYTQGAAVTSNYVAMYRNGDGRVGISPSARRFKKEITDHEYTLDDACNVRPVDYRLKAEVYGSADAPVETGVIAEELIAAGLSEFVAYDENGEPLSVHYERLALVALGALREVSDRLAALEARHE